MAGKIAYDMIFAHCPGADAEAEEGFVIAGDIEAEIGGEAMTLYVFQSEGDVLCPFIQGSHTYWSSVSIDGAGDALQLEIRAVYADQTSCVGGEFLELFLLFAPIGTHPAPSRRDRL